MNRIIVLALLAPLATACAAEFGDGDPAQEPPEIGESQAGAVRTFNGRLDRPAQAIGTLADQSTTTESTQLYSLFQSAQNANVELGAKYSRSTK